MKRLLLIFGILALVSCNRNVFGIYDSISSKDKAAYFSIRLNRDQTVEKNEIHTISDQAQGRFEKKGRIVICYFDSSKSGFPPDTAIFRLKGGKLFFIREGVSKKVYLLKQ